MIPRILHSAWFGRGEKSELFRQCMATQRKAHPDWTFYEWSEENLGPWMQTPYIKSVLERKEWVKATEIARLVGLFVIGGVYMDCDVEVIKSFDPLLQSLRPTHGDFFIGRESAQDINGAVMASEPGGRVIAELVRQFPAQTDGRLGAHSYGPTYLTTMLNAMGEDKRTLAPEFFYPYHWSETVDKLVVTPNTYAAHHWAKSWVGKY